MKYWKIQTFTVYKYIFRKNSRFKLKSSKCFKIFFKIFEIIKEKLLKKLYIKFITIKIKNNHFVFKQIA